jgi:hypothetical protein
MSALSSTFVVIDTATGDLDGDGKDETAVCYREDVSRTEQVSGIVIYAGKGADMKPVFHVQLDEALCEKLKIGGRKLGITLGGNKQLVWTYGEEIKFRGDKGSLQSSLKASSSSYMDSSHTADKAIDGDLATSWAEGAQGTGLGQTLTIKLAKATDIGAIGIFSGDGNGQRTYFDNNRLHRASLEAKTEADVGDSAAGIDFSSLGIETMGDRAEFTCENKPQVTYVHVGKKGVVELNLRIESVYLGDKKDDTHIAEIEIVPVLSLRETVDRATTTKATESKPDGKKVDDKKVDGIPKGDDAMKKLDQDGRSIIKDDL